MSSSDESDDDSSFSSDFYRRGGEVIAITPEATRTRPDDAATRTPPDDAATRSQWRKFKNTGLPGDVPDVAFHAHNVAANLWGVEQACKGKKIKHIVNAIKKSVPFLEFKGRHTGEKTPALKLRIECFFKNAVAELAENKQKKGNLLKLEALRKEEECVTPRQQRFGEDEKTRMLLICHDDRAKDKRIACFANDQTRQQLDMHGANTFAKFMEPLYNDKDFKPDQAVLENSILYKHLDPNRNIPRRDGSTLNHYFNKLRKLYSEARSRFQASGQGGGGMEEYTQADGNDEGDRIPFENFCRDDKTHELVLSDSSFEFMNRATPSYVDIESGKINYSDAYNKDKSSSSSGGRSCSNRKKRVRKEKDPVALKVFQSEEEKSLLEKKTDYYAAKVLREEAKTRRENQQHDIQQLQTAMKLYIRMGEPVPQKLKDKLKQLVERITM